MAHLCADMSEDHMALSVTIAGPESRSKQPPREDDDDDDTFTFDPLRPLSVQQTVNTQQRIHQRASPGRLVNMHEKP